MESRIAGALHLRYQPVAVVLADEAPDDAQQFAEGRWGCVVSLIAAAAKGRTVAFCDETCGCGGGKVGLGFSDFNRSWIEPFLSTGTPETEGEHHRKTPECAAGFVDSLPDLRVPTRYVVMKPFSALAEEDEPVLAVMLVDADQLAGWVTLANYDTPYRDNTILGAGSACQSIVLLGLEQAGQEWPRAVLGMTDPAARRYVDRDLLSVTVPWRRFLEMEGNVEGSFLTYDVWAQLSERIATANRPKALPQEALHESSRAADRASGE